MNKICNMKQTKSIYVKSINRGNLGKTYFNYIFDEKEKRMVLGIRMLLLTGKNEDFEEQGVKMIKRYKSKVLHEKRFFIAIKTLFNGIEMLENKFLKI